MMKRMTQNPKYSAALLNAPTSPFHESCSFILSPLFLPTAEREWALPCCIHVGDTRRRNAHDRKVNIIQIKSTIGFYLDFFCITEQPKRLYSIEIHSDPRRLCVCPHQYSSKNTIPVSHHQTSAPSAAHNKGPAVTGSELQTASQSRYYYLSRQGGFYSTPSFSGHTVHRLPTFQTTVLYVDKLVLTCMQTLCFQTPAAQQSNRPSQI